MTTRGKVITANVLTDGVTVYLGDGDIWTPSLAKARLLTDEAEQERQMKRAEEDVRKLVIVDPYLMDAEASADGPRPVTQRERIRARGPTIQYVFS
jgi:sulfite reductase (NADPH) hemoprotein beta-component